jgi:hypothetical protein
MGRHRGAQLAFYRNDHRNTRKEIQMSIQQQELSKQDAARRARYELSAGTVGAIAGAGFGGIFAGPAGAAAGAVVGAAMGAATGWAAEMRAKEDALHDAKLDREIGVVDGDLGVPGLRHPASRPVALSREVSGAGSAVETRQAGGPIQAPPDED